MFVCLFVSYFGGGGGAKFVVHSFTVMGDLCELCCINKLNVNIQTERNPEES